MTSHDVVNMVRRKMGTRRVGHAGTLDPLAAGVLVVAVGPATRFLQYLPLEPKEYVADIRFGQSTSTYDAEGQPAHTGPVPSNLLEAAMEARKPLMGLIRQLPPIYSAVKLNGKPLYAYARKGEEVTREPRTVHVGTFDLTQIDETTLQARIVCSGGTYVRTLAHDLGMALGCGAYLSNLVRTAVGRFSLELAKSLDEVSGEDLIPLREALPPLPLISLSADEAGDVREGRPVRITPNMPIDGPLAGFLDPSDAVIGIGRVAGVLLQPECVLPKEAALGI